MASISWVRLVDRRVDATARGDATVSELLLDRGPSARYAMMICSRSFILFRSLAALPTLKLYGENADLTNLFSLDPAALFNRLVSAD